jgi:hypothetical protein
VGTFYVRNEKAYLISFIEDVESRLPCLTQASPLGNTSTIVGCIMCSEEVGFAFLVVVAQCIYLTRMKTIVQQSVLCFVMCFACLSVGLGRIGITYLFVDVELPRGEDQMVL